MGYRFRKSIKLGKHVRINLSKSGIGYSIGTKGYRVTKMANGRTRTTVSIPGTGISHVSETSSKRTPSSYSKSNSVTTCKCPVCGRILFSNESYCRECGLDVRPVNSYIPLVYPKRVNTFDSFAFLFYVIFGILLIIFLSAFGYQDINYPVVNAIFVGSIFSFLIGIVFSVTSLRIRKRVDSEHTEACAIEEKRRSVVIQNMIAERAEKERISREEAERIKSEELLTVRKRILAEKEKERKESEDIKRRHEQFVSDRMESAVRIFDSIARVSVVRDPLSVPIPPSPISQIKINKLMKNTGIEKLTDYIALDVGTSVKTASSVDITYISAIRFVNFTPVTLFYTPMSPSNALYSSDSHPKFHEISSSFCDFLGTSSLVGFSVYSDLRVLHEHGFADPVKNRSRFDVLDSAHSIDDDMDTSDLRTICRRYTFHYPDNNYEIIPLAIGYLFNCYVAQKLAPEKSDFPGLYEWN